jgi:hypothetical protein
MLKQVIEVMELLDDPGVSGEKVRECLEKRGAEEVRVESVAGKKGKTDFVKILVKGKYPDAPTLGIIGRLGGVGARPERIGYVSDGDGAAAALSAALKLVDMRVKGDILDCNVMINTHVCPDAPTLPHEPVPFMGGPVDMKVMNEHEVDSYMDAILSVDTTKGNRILNQRGFAITPTVKGGWILRVSENLLDVMERVTGRLPVVLPITMQDITPYENEIYHINSIMQPATATKAPVVGVAITAEAVVPGCATGAGNAADIEQAARFCVEVAKDFGCGRARFYDEREFERLVSLFGGLDLREK